MILAFSSLDATSLDFVAIVVGLLGGLSLFLFGMEMMTDALKRVAGNGMRTMLGKLTTNRFTAALTGAIVTAVIQSSSVTTVLVVGFVTANLMTLGQSVGVIMGANVGTTITAQIVAFKVTKYALVLIALGFALNFIPKKRTVRDVGAMVMGLGLIFFGMGLMSDATNPLRGYPPFIDLMQNMDTPVLAILVSAAFTALVQSSSATTGIVIVLATQGFISLEAGIALAFGANLGTCFTAALATLGKPRAATRAAAVHVLFNLIGVLIWLPFIGPLATVVRDVSPAHPELAGAARLAAETPRQIANAHTVFNIANTVLLIGFTGLLAKLVMKLFPDRPAKIPEVARPKFLEDVYLATPALAIDRVRLEVSRLGGLAQRVMEEISQRDRIGGLPERDAYRTRLGEMQLLYDAIVDYSRRIVEQDLSERDGARIEQWTIVANNLQAFVDSIALNLYALGARLQEERLAVSDATDAKFRSLARKIARALDLAVKAVEGEDESLARQVVDMKDEVSAEADALGAHLLARLGAGEGDRRTLYRLESEAVEIFRRLYYFAKRIAKTVVRVVDVDPREEEAART